MDEATVAVLLVSKNFLASDFIATHKAELEDHYGRYRYICERLQNA